MQRSHRAVLPAIISVLAAWLWSCPAQAEDSAAPAGEAAAGAARTHIERQLFALGPVDPARPDKIRRINADCLSCHSEQGLKAPPRTDLDLARLARLTVSPQHWGASVHAGLACTSCHDEGLTAFPHPASAEAKARPCLECHPKAGRTLRADFEESRHFLRHKQQFTCATCHDPHVMRRARDLGSPAAIAQADNRVCLGCHGDGAKFATLKAARPMPDLSLHHAWLPNARLHWQAVRCIDCHALATEAGYSHRFTRIVNATRACTSCHKPDSALRGRLYRAALVQPTVDSAGFLNGAIRSQAYVIGANRNLWLEQALLVAGIVVLVAAGGHAVLRLLTAGRRQHRSERHPVYLFGGWIRLWHWLNLILMLALAASALSMHFASGPLHLMRFGLARQIHDWAGIALIVAYAGFVGANASTANFRQFVPSLGGLAGRSWIQARYYLWGMFRGEPEPFPITLANNFNPLQQLVYLLIVYAVMPVLILSGLLFLVPDILPDQLFGMQALTLVAMVHSVAAGVIVLFALAHLYIATAGPTVLSHLRAMITGWSRE